MKLSDELKAETKKAASDYVDLMISDMVHEREIGASPPNYEEMKYHLLELMHLKFRVVRQKYVDKDDILNPKHIWGNNINFQGLRNHLKGEIGEWVKTGWKSHLDTSGYSSMEVAMNDEILELVDIVNMCFMVIAESLALRSSWQNEERG